jgi:deazaflavin-dependent oxidoreductase (nitroreductase family)
MSDTAPTFKRKRPNPLLKLFFRAPVALYRDGPAELLRRRCVMLMTTIGRRSGKPRTNGVSFMEVDGRYVVFSGWGIASNWYQNILVHPEVTLQVGNRTMRATAVPVADPQRRQELMQQMRAQSSRCGPPTFIRPLLRLTRVFDYDAELDLAVAQAEALPVIELIPHGNGGAFSDRGR